MKSVPLRAYEAPKQGRLIVPVEIPGFTGNCAVTHWNMAVRRWHRVAEK